MKGIDVAKPGKKPKPTALKLLQGNPGKRPINDEEPQPPKVYKPRAPRGMSDHERAKWRQMVKLLGGMRVLTAADLDALEMYCRNWCLMIEALRDINERGKLLTSPNGGVIWNPSWSAYKHAESIVRKLQVEFGLTPSSRTAVKAIGDDTGKNRWGDF